MEEVKENIDPLSLTPMEAADKYMDYLEKDLNSGTFELAVKLKAMHLIQNNMYDELLEKIKMLVDYHDIINEVVSVIFASFEENECISHIEQAKEIVLSKKIDQNIH